MTKHTTQISGSIAFDTLLTYNGRFSEQILSDQISTLNIAFLVPKMRKEFGGCAANIAYNLSALGDTSILLGSVGKDANEYLDKFKKLGIDTSQIINCSDDYTAQAFITTDEDGNQITSFHPGAMMSSEIPILSECKTNIGIVSPNSHHAMTQHSNDFFDKNIKFIFDPGQALPMFDINDLNNFISKATWIAVNEYESEMLCKVTGNSLKELPHKLLANKSGAVFQTLGSKGCKVFTKENDFLVEPLSVPNAIDPTGCGDAFRAGILFGLARGLSPHNSACIGNVLGSIKVRTIGGQNHTLNLTNISNLIQKHFPKYKINLHQ
jgi:adenosine kinase